MSTLSDLAEVGIWVALLGAVTLPIRAAWARSAGLMWAAALCSLAISMVGVYSVGALVFLATCLELGAAAALRHRADARGWAASLLAAILAWVVVVPLQVAGVVWLPWIAAFPLVVVAGTLVVLPPRRFAFSGETPLDAHGR